MVLQKMQQCINASINSIINEVNNCQGTQQLNELPEEDDVQGEEDDEYWSDFSDEDFQVEDREEKEALNTLYKL